MSNGYSRTPKLLKGALIQFSAPMLVPIPNIIIFQYNPETMTRTLAPWLPPVREMTSSYKAEQEAVVFERAALSKEQVNHLRQPYDPDESFSLTLELDATDALEHPLLHPVAVNSGIADRIAALEMLCYPPAESAEGGRLNVPVSASVGAGNVDGSASVGTQTDFVPRREVPIVLFSWGPDRIVPVRIVSFSVEEQQYSPSLHPIRAKVSIGLKVITDMQLVDATGDFATGGAMDLAKACYRFTKSQRANLANGFETFGTSPI